MRVKVTNQGLTVQGIAGTYVVLLGFDMNEANCGGLYHVRLITYQPEEPHPAKATALSPLPASREG